jgi:hypothetical protein
VAAAVAAVTCVIAPQRRGIRCAVARVDKKLIVSEAAAIVLHLIDQHADTGIAPQIGTPERLKLTPNESSQT